MTRARVTSIEQALGLVLGILIGAATICSHAHAQPWLPDRQYAEGPGLRAGNVEFHPGVAVRGGYDNNVFRADGKVRDGVKRPLQAAGILAVTPHVYMSTLGQQRKTQGEARTGETPELRMIDFRAGLSATYLKYFIDEGPNNVDVDSDVFVGIAPGRPFGAEVSAGYLRSTRPFTQTIVSGTDVLVKPTSKAYIYDVIDPKLRLKFGSRSQVLTAYVGYAPVYTLYESRQFDFLTNINHGVEAGAAWKFLPSTALIYDARLGLQYYSDGASPANLLLYSDGKVFRTRLGINGALTNNLSLRVLAGYAAVAIENGKLDDHEDAVAEVSLGYRFADVHSFELGYQRDVQAAALGGWTQTDMGQARLNLLFARRFAVVVQGGVGYARYGRLWSFDDNDADSYVPLGEGGTTKRTDIRADGALRFEYRATDWLAFMADFSVTSIMTDFAYRAVNGTPADPAGFTTFQAYGGVRAHY